MPATLAEIVIAESLITAAKLAQAADAADRGNIPLVVPLVRDHSIDEVALVAALKKHLRIKTLDPAKLEFDSDALRELSLNDCRRLRGLPLSIGIYGAGPRLLSVAMADPTDTVSLAELEHLSGCAVEPVLVTLSAVEEMIETAYKHFVTEVMKRSAIAGTPGKRAKSFTGGTGIRPKTAPFHRVTDEASPAQRIAALVQLCVQKGLFEESEYDMSLRELLREAKSSKES